VTKVDITEISSKTSRGVLLFSFIFIATIMVAIYWTYSSYTLRMVEKKHGILHSTIHTIIDDENNHYRSHVQHLLNNHHLSTWLRDRNTQALAVEFTSLFESLKNENPYFRSLCIFDVEGDVLFAMAHPCSFDQKIAANRPSSERIRHEKSFFSSFEQTSQGSTYHLMMPIFDDTTYIGAVDIGLDVELFVARFYQFTQIKTALFINDPPRLATLTRGITSHAICYLQRLMMIYKYSLITIARVSLSPPVMVSHWVINTTISTIFLSMKIALRMMPFFSSLRIYQTIAAVPTMCCG